MSIIRNTVYLKDLENIICDETIPWHRLDKKSVIISGATGLIGRTITDAMLTYCRDRNSSTRITILVRDPEKARRFFGENNSCLNIIKWDIKEIPAVGGPVDYIVHCASQTSSRGFVEQPVETIETSYLGTAHLLKLAKEKNVQGFVYLSTMETYGTPQTDDKIDENYVGTIDALKVRNCYPESKRLCENLCVAYANEYQIPACIARLTQTFGPGVQSDDKRVFAEFARCAIDKQDIILHTKGETKRNYVYTADAVRAILLLLLCGEPAHAYNVANEGTYCSIYEMAEMVAKQIADEKIQVKCILAEDIEKMGYAPVLHMNLDTKKIQNLGWKPYVDLTEMFRRLVASFKE